MRCFFPVKPWIDARITAGFLDPAYKVWRERNGIPPAAHPGIDIAVGRPGTSLGYPVRCVRRGVVVHAHFHTTWGPIVLVRHFRTEADDFKWWWWEGRVANGIPNCWSQYSHLQHMTVREGQPIDGGEDIGSIGAGDPMRPFAPHLHFEIRLSPLTANYWPGTDENFIRRHYMDPLVFLDRFNAEDRAII